MPTFVKLFINREQNQFMVVQMPDEITPDKYQVWITQEENEQHVLGLRVFLNNCLTALP